MPHVTQKQRTKQKQIKPDTVIIVPSVQTALIVIITFFLFFFFFYSWLYKQEVIITTAHCQRIYLKKHCFDISPKSYEVCSHLQEINHISGFEVHSEAMKQLYEFKFSVQWKRMDFSFH